MADERPEDRGTLDRDAWSLLEDLPEMDRAFVVKVLKGSSVEEAALDTGWKTELGLVRVLGRPRVQEALERLVPLAMEPKDAAKALSRYWLGRLVTTSSRGSAAQATQATRELANLAGYSVSKSEVLHATVGDVINALQGRAVQNPPKKLRAAKVEVVESACSEVPSTDSESEAPRARSGTRLPPGRLKR